MTTHQDAPKLCECGCGQPAPIATRNDAKFGWIKGQPKRFIRGHTGRAPRRTTVQERFWAKVDKHGAIHPVLHSRCWIWTASVNDFGYGRFRGKQGDTTAHRFSYELHIGPVPAELWVLHHCDNPACANPAHLFLGTRQDNVDDMIAKNRHRQGHCPAGESNPAAKLTEQDVLRIRELAARTQRQQLADIYGVSKATIEKIISRSVWSHI